jgi:hypothetical protein
MCALFFFGLPKERRFALLYSPGCLPLLRRNFFSSMPWRTFTVPFMRR